MQWGKRCALMLSFGGIDLVLSIVAEEEGDDGISPASAALLSLCLL